VKARNEVLKTLCIKLLHDHYSPPKEKEKNYTIFMCPLQFKERVSRPPFLKIENREKKPLIGILHLSCKDVKAKKWLMDDKRILLCKTTEVQKYSS